MQFNYVSYRYTACPKSTSLQEAATLHPTKYFILTENTKYIKLLNDHYIV
jgi:hypothetical protein